MEIIMNKCIEFEDFNGEKFLIEKDKIIGAKMHKTSDDFYALHIYTPSNNFYTLFEVQEDGLKILNSIRKFKEGGEESIIDGIKTILKRYLEEATEENMNAKGRYFYLYNKIMNFLEMKEEKNDTISEI